MSNTRIAAITWMRTHPEVVDMFERFAAQLVSRQRKFGINLLRERVRWECKYEYDNDKYKFCNDFSPYVARYLLGKHLDWSQNLTCKLTKDEQSEIEYIYSLE